MICICCFFSLLSNFLVFDLMHIGWGVPCRFHVRCAVYWVNWTRTAIQCYFNWTAYMSGLPWYIACPFFPP